MKGTKKTVFIVEETFLSGKLQSRKENLEKKLVEMIKKAEAQKRL